jgi:hypothetical protein
VKHALPYFSTLALLSALVACSNLLGIPEERLLESQSDSGTLAPDVAVEGGPSGPAKCQGKVLLNLQADFDSAIKDWSIPTFKGFYDYLREQNEKGGPGGCTYDMVVKNNSYTPAKAQTIYEEWRAQPRFKDVLMVLNAGTPDTNQIAPLARSDMKLHFTGSSAARFTSPLDLPGKTVDVPKLSSSFGDFNEPTSVGRADGYPYLFFAGTDYTSTARLGSKIAAELGVKRPAYVACTTSIYCTDPLPAARVTAAQVKLLPGRSLTIELSNTQDEIIQKTLEFFQAEKAKKVELPAYEPVDWLWMGNTSKTTAYFINAVAIAMKELQWVPTMATKPPAIMINSAGFDEELPVLAKQFCNNSVTDPTRKLACAEAFTDLRVFGAVAFTPFGEPASAMQAVKTLQEKWLAADKATADPNLAELATADLKERKNLRYVQGYATGLMFDTALRKTLERGKPINVENVRETLEATRVDSLGGLVPSPVTFTAKDHRPQAGALVYQIDPSGKIVPAPGIAKPFLAREDAELGW